MHYITIIGLALACCQISSLEALDESIKRETSTKFSAEDISALFTANGQTVSVVSDKYLKTVFNAGIAGNRTAIIRIGEGDISIYSVHVLPEKVKNRDDGTVLSFTSNWNANKRFTSVYNDSDGDLTLQSDLFLCDDYNSNVELVGKFMTTFIKSVTDIYIYRHTIYIS
eukprot:CAMPEP_0185022594 /NCGR_PEP_ID=MMETSP1103-20130426/5297_1 /TAXON_ID=36769 /ORGANISM="Paraphysomonas bandaiensis, Strain Caron Lab Isolate" /LENGTH=168 /DNA_ID=CAMNT_0027554723 /DNA_START=61 /DNA_END=567 /DNA_ORIENTATION=-